MSHASDYTKSLEQAFGRQRDFPGDLNQRILDGVRGRRRVVREYDAGDEAAEKAERNEIESNWVNANG